MTDPEADLDPILRSLLAAAQDVGEDPDDMSLAEHLVERLFGGPTSREGRIRAACVDAAMEQRRYFKNRFETMHRRLARIVARSADPEIAFERLRSIDVTTTE